MSELPERIKLLKKQFKKPRTMNQAIERIWNSDMKRGVERPRKWLFYTHLNKLAKPMERMGIIKLHGHEVGPTNRTEKVWVLK